jgi:glycine amidinotransferase
VFRPDVPLSLNKQNDPYIFDLQTFQYTFPNHPLMPRDTLFVYGNQIIETFTGSGGRFLENWAYRNILKVCAANGADWQSMPVPMLCNKLTYAEYNNANEVLFHAANMVKCGEHIIVSHPTTKDGVWQGKGTEAGLHWLKKTVGEEKFVQAPCQGHIDGKMALLKPGVVATWDVKYLPDSLQKWSCIQIDSPPPFPEYFMKIKKQRFYKDFVQQWLSDWIGYVDETVFDVNMLSVSPELVITNGYNKEAYTAFKLHGIEAIPWNFRHQYFWDGAIHCVTLDLNRDGGPENYLC